MIRKFKESAKREFGSWITKFDWSLLFQIQCVNEKVAYFSTITWLMIEKYFPVQKITISTSDKEWMTVKIKDLINQRQKAHKANNFELKNILAKKVRDEIRKAKVNYNNKKAHLFHMSNPREWYRHINKIMGNKNKKLNFTNIPELAFKAIDDQIKIVNEHFANICKKYPPLNSNLVLSSSPNEKSLPVKTEFETYQLLTKYAKKSLGPGDFPQKIIQEFAPEFATPFCDILNCSLRSKVFPDAYKKAEIIPIPKVNPPRSLSDLRPISKTPIGGKIIEKVIMSELEKNIKGKLNGIIKRYDNKKKNVKKSYFDLSSFEVLFDIKSSSKFRNKEDEDFYLDQKDKRKATIGTVDLPDSRKIMQSELRKMREEYEEIKPKQKGVRGKRKLLLEVTPPKHAKRPRFAGSYADLDNSTCSSSDWEEPISPRGKNLRTQRNCNTVNVSIDKEAFLYNIALASDKTLTPSRTAAQIVGATLSTASDSAEVNRLTLSHSSLHRRRDKLRLSSDKVITENWKKNNENSIFLLHWDEKSLRHLRQVDGTDSYMAVVLTNLHNGEEILLLV